MKYLSFVLFFFPFYGDGAKPRALPMLGKYSTLSYVLSLKRFLNEVNYL
jgi:hypothetical protein